MREVHTLLALRLLDLFSILAYYRRGPYVFHGTLKPDGSVQLACILV